MNALGDVVLAAFIRSFEARVRKGDGCWIWLGKIIKDGYGAVRLPDGSFTGAHRIGWAIANGVWAPSELDVLHSCDNPPCCNPAHLRLGTDADNARDRKERQRGGQDKRRGSAHPRAKIDDDGVNELRALRRDGATYASHGRRFGMTYQNARSIATGETWAHVK